MGWGGLMMPVDHLLDFLAARMSISRICLPLLIRALDADQIASDPGAGDGADRGGVAQKPGET